MSKFAPGGTTAIATLANLNQPYALAFDNSGDLFVANSNGITVSEFAPGGTTPSATLSHVNGPLALAFDGNSNLYVANYSGNSISKFAPATTTPSYTVNDSNGGNNYAVALVASTTGVINKASLTITATTNTKIVRFHNHRQGNANSVRPVGGDNATGLSEAYGNGNASVQTRL